MKFLPLIWTGLWRRPVRTIFTALSILVAFLLLGLLEGINAGFEKSIADSHREYLATDLRVRGGPQMPISAADKIRAIPGVKELTYRAYFAGTFGGSDPRNGIAAIATEIDIWFRVRPTLVTAQENIDAMLKDRAGLLVTPPVLKLLNLKVGDTVTLRSKILKTDGSGDWTFHIVGTFDAAAEPTTTGFGLINYDYLNRGRAENRDMVERFMIHIADPMKAMETAASIDAIFANSPHETRTRSDQQRAESQAKQLGDIKFFTNAIMGAVLFTLAFLTSNTLRQSLQERAWEFATLKSFGYADSRVFGLAVAEALLLYLPAAIVGLLLAYLTAPLGKDDLGTIVVSLKVAMLGIACATVFAVASVAVPAWEAARLSISDSLGRK